MIILIAIAAIATLATYIVPAGTYDMIEVAGRKAVDPTSFHYIEQTPVGIWDAILTLPGGFSKQMAIISMITFIAGAMGMICGLAGGAFCTSSTAVAQQLVGFWTCSPAGRCACAPLLFCGRSTQFS